jgi:hypothetical protein
LGGISRNEPIVRVPANQLRVALARPNTRAVNQGRFRFA